MIYLFLLYFGIAWQKNRIIAKATSQYNSWVSIFQIGDEATAKLFKLQMANIPLSYSFPLYLVSNSSLISIRLTFAESPVDALMTANSISTCSVHDIRA